MKAIDPSVKTQVIELFQAKKEYAEIVQILKTQNIEISFGSCWNIVSKWKRDSMSLSQNKGSVEPQLKSQSSTLELKASGIITRIPLNKDASSPSSSIGEGKAAIPTTEITHNKTPRDGGPLSHLLPS